MNKSSYVKALWPGVKALCTSTASETRHTDSFFLARDGRLQVGTKDGSVVTININEDSIEFDGIVITTEMLRNVAQKTKEETKEGTDW